MVTARHHCGRGWRAGLLGLLALVAASTAADGGDAATPGIVARPTQLSDALANGNRIGRLRVLGVLELLPQAVNRLRFAELSDLAWNEDDGVLYALSDQGALFTLKPVFSGDLLTGIKLLAAVPLRELGSGKPVRWKRSDAEGLDILKGNNRRRGDAELLVSFEREPRILRYRPDGTALEEYRLPAALADVRHYQGENLALESVCLHPRHGILTAPEAPLRGETAGRHRVYSLNGNSWTYPLEAGNHIVSLQPTDDGGLLVLERNYTALLGRTVIALKKLPPLPDKPDQAPLQPSLIAQLSSSNGLQLDNFEGLTRHRGNRYFMVSDNNDVFLQRTLLMYFEIMPE